MSKNAHDKGFVVPHHPSYDGGDAITLETPGVKELIDAAVTEAVGPLVAKRDEILGEKKTLAAEFAALKETWINLDPEQVRAMLKTIEGSEEAKLLTEGKVDEVLERRTEKLRAQAGKDVKAALDKVETLQGKLDASTARIKRLVVDHSVREAAGKIEGFVPSAMFDAVSRAHGVFTIQDDDPEAVVALDPKDGTIKRGKDGKSPLGINEWLSDVVTGECRHWLAPSSGGGAKGSGDGEGKGSASEVENMSPRDKLAKGLREQADA